MRIISLLYIPALVAVLAQAAPVPDQTKNSVRALKLPKPKINSPKPAPKPAPAPPPKAPAPPPKAPPPAPPKATTTPTVQKTTAAPAASSAKTTTPPSSAPSATSSIASSAIVTSAASSQSSATASSVQTTTPSPAPLSSASSAASSSGSSSASITSSASSQTSATASSTSSAAGPNNTTTPDDGSNSTDAFCPIYSQADLADLEARHVALQKRAKKKANEEYWFRWEDAGLAKAGDILQLKLPHDKNFDDQAYKWISTNAAKVTRGKIQPGRVGTVFVLPAGTRDAVLGAAKKFEETSAAQQPADFVTKDNEAGDVGIQGITNSADGTLPLDVFRNKVIRTVVKKTAAKGKNKATFVTITKGKRSNTATQDDQQALDFACG